ncbi:MAG: hypothetical protein P8K76_09040 [Candidatus Binatia bacterium]|nr:hypothetical protein [Candidatus Binatia bacterium]
MRFLCRCIALAVIFISLASPSLAGKFGDQLEGAARACWVGGLCGIDGYAFGTYVDKTREDLGCEIGEEGVDYWQMGVDAAPLLPEFARDDCAFFYGYEACLLPSVACRQ